MTDAKLAPPLLAPDLEDADTDLPPQRVPQPDVGREVLVHWIITVGGFTAMLLVGLYFTK